MENTVLLYTEVDTMLSCGNTLHFVNRIDNKNCGDWLVCPLLYYYEYFKQYNIKRHDVRYIEFDSIAKGDVVIIGGGGLFNYAEFTNRAINRLLDTGATVIAWAPGFNTHDGYANSFHTEINFERFALIAVRDYENKYRLDYLPDVTCMLNGLRNSYTIRRKIGIAMHKDHPIMGLNYESIQNTNDIEEILQFIGESEIIISNSYHLIYWALLMGKKTICANPFSSRFSNYKYKPEYFYSELDNLQDSINNAQQYSILNECIESNNKFFEQVKIIIENKLKPVSDDMRMYDMITNEALMMEKVRENQITKGDLLSSQLFVDIGTGFSDINKLVSINNVYGDEVSTAIYELSQIHNIKALRFDPIEGYNCAVQIISAKIGESSIILNAEAAVQEEGWDKFLTTDPHYFITEPVNGILKIEFRLRLLSRYEEESNIFSYVERNNYAILQKSRLIEEQEHSIEQKGIQIAQLKRDIENMNAKINLQNKQIVSQGKAIELQNTYAIQQKIKIDSQDEQIRQQVECLNRQSEQIDAIYSSTSWKITKPVRETKNFIKRIFKGLR